MKKLLGILVLGLLLITPSQADDVGDFQIEGISVGDSLLDYMSVDKIKKALRKDTTFFYPKEYRNKKFASIGVKSKDLNRIQKKFKIYDELGIIIDSNSNNYEIFALEGTLISRNGDIKDCYKKQIEVANDIQGIIPSKYKRDAWFQKKEKLRSYQLSVKYIDFKTRDRKPFQLVCYDINKNGNKYTALYVAVDSVTFDKFLVYMNR